MKACGAQVPDGFAGAQGMAVSASAHNMVMMDREGAVIRPCIMWNDQRSGDQCRRLQQEHGQQIFDIAMAMPTPTWTLPQLMWVKENEPEHYARIHRLMFTKDYVRSWVTGDFCTDVVDAQGSLLFDARRGEWSPALCARADHCQAGHCRQCERGGRRGQPPQQDLYLPLLCGGAEGV